MVFFSDQDRKQGIYNCWPYPLRHGASFYPLLVSFRLQITHRKVRNLQKVLINL